MLVNFLRTNEEQKRVGSASWCNVHCCHLCWPCSGTKRLYRMPDTMAAFMAMFLQLSMSQTKKLLLVLLLLLVFFIIPFSLIGPVMILHLRSLLQERWCLWYGWCFNAGSNIFLYNLPSTTKISLNFIFSVSPSKLNQVDINFNWFSSRSEIL